MENGPFETVVRRFCRKYQYWLEPDDIRAQAALIRLEVAAGGSTDDAERVMINALRRWRTKELYWHVKRQEIDYDMVSHPRKPGDMAVKVDLKRWLAAAKPRQRRRFVLWAEGYGLSEIARREGLRNGTASIGRAFRRYLPYYLTYIHSYCENDHPRRVNPSGECKWCINGRERRLRLRRKAS